MRFIVYNKFIVPGKREARPRRPTQPATDLPFNPVRPIGLSMDTVLFDLCHEFFIIIIIFSLFTCFFVNYNTVYVTRARIHWFYPIAVGIIRGRFGGGVKVET